MKKIILFACALIALSSCKKDNDIDSSNQEEEGIEIKFRSDILTSDIQSLSSRAPLTSNNLPVGDHVGIFGLDAIVAQQSKFTLSNSAALKKMSNIKFQVEDNIGNLKCTNGRRYTYPNDGTHDGMAFYAYYPYQKDTKRYKIDVNYSNIDNIDYLYTGQITEKTSIDPVSLNFKHAMSRIVVKINNKTKSNINSVTSSIGFTNFPTTGEMKIEDGSIEPFTWDESITIDDDATNIAPNEIKTISDNIVFPGTVIDDIECNINGSEKQMKTNLAITAEKGKFITITLVYEPKEPLFISRVDDWVNQKNIDIIIKEK